ncbi:MAG: sortase [Patescibacteria group bacterium]
MPPSGESNIYPVKVSHHAPHLKERHFRILNHFLLVILVLLAAYIMFIPFLPEVYDFYDKYFDKTKGYKYSSKLATSEIIEKQIDRASLRKIPDYNVLVIPKIGVDSPIVEGLGAEALNQGVWRRPQSSTPDKGGNTVLTGHRYLYASGPKTFYHLDKVSLGDKFLVFWQGKEYDYEVVDIFTVGPDQTEVEDQTNEPLITMYTCTPLWNPTLRLVIRARLINS